MNLIAYINIQSLGLGTIIHLCLFGLVAAHILRLPREPRSTLLWLFVTGFFPFFGAVFYLSFGINHVPRRGWRKFRSDVRFRTTRSRSEKAANPLAYWRALRDSLAAPLINRSQEATVNSILDRLAHEHPLLGGNEVEVISGGMEPLEEMFAAIDKARHHIHLLSYIIGHDTVGRELLERLAARAQNGVEVRLLYDQYGSRGAYLRGLFRRYSRLPNMKCVGYTHARLIKRQFQINLRNHRKILVIDGEVGFLGGVNFHDVYLLERRNVRDYHFKVKGPAVLELQYTFLRDWFYMSTENADTLLTPEHFPKTDAVGETPLRLLNAGPQGNDQPLIDLLFALLAAARRQILLTTPYFVLTEDLRRAFRAAALRGVEIKVLLPSLNNHPTVAWAARASYEELLTSGVRLYLRRPPFIHAKAMVVDDRIALFGSANLDPRSLRLNYETNFIAFDPSLSARLKRTLLDDFACADELTLALWRQRPLHERYLENFFNLMSPIL